MVFYFTATGNSLYVAKCIDEYPVSIPQVIKNSSIYSDNQIGIVCPVYCGEIPNSVKEFLKKSKFDTKYMYIILTYGNSASDCPEFTYNEFKALGINFDYIDTVHCVDNYLPVFDMAEEKKIDKDTDVQIAHIIKNIRLMKKGVPTAIDADRKLHKQVATLNKIIPSFNNGNMIKITDKCIGCKVCEKGLPDRQYNCADGLRTKAKQKNANTALPAFTLALKRQLSLSTRKTKTSDTGMKMYHSMK